MSEQLFYGTGRRKSSIARVFVYPGKGEITVNGKPFRDYLCRDTLATVVTQPLVATESQKTYNIKIGHENIDKTTIQFVVQGSWQSDDHNKYMYTITLPNFQTRL